MNTTVLVNQQFQERGGVIRPRIRRRRLCGFVHVVLASLGAVLSVGKSCANDSVASTHMVSEPCEAEGTIITFITDSNKEPTYQGLPLGLWIQTNTPINPSKLGLKELLSLKQVSKPDDLGTVWFEVPINYDALRASGGKLDLGVLSKDGRYVECCFEGTERGTKGRSRIYWVTPYDPPGEHHLRVRLTLSNRLDLIEVIGPPLTFFSSNACWFPEDSTLFAHYLTALYGIKLHAVLREKAASYKIVLKTVKGRHIRTFTGNTTNGVIDLEWDATDDRGRKFSGESFQALFYIRYPGDKRYGPPVKAWFNRIGG